MIVYRDGRYQPQAATATETADGVFTTLRLYQGRAPDLAAHHARLADHAAQADLGAPPPVADLQQIIGDLVDRNGLDRSDHRLRIALTRGLARPVLAVEPGRLPTELSLWQRMGIGVITLAADCRRRVTPHLKTFAGLTPPRATRAAADAGCPEALILGEKQQLLEGIYSNVFLVSDGVLLTPPDSEPLLAGRTRQLILALAPAAGLKARTQHLDPTDLQRTAEIFLVNAVREVVPVITVNDRPVGDGRPGPVTRTCQTLYRGHLEALEPGR